MAVDQTSTRAIINQPRKQNFNQYGTYLGPRFVLEDCLNALYDLRGKLWNNLDRLKIINDLLGTRRAEDDRARVRLLRNPCKSEMPDLTAKFYGLCKL